MKRAFSLALIASMVLGAMFTGCSQDGVAASTPAETSSVALAKENTGKKNVVLILKNLTNPMWVEVKEGAEEAAQKAGVNLTTLAPVQSENNDEQISEIEQSISKGVDAIVIAPADSSGIVPGVEKANAANIPVIAINTKIDTSSGAKMAAFVGVDSYDCATTIAEKLSSMMDQTGEVMILEGKAGAQTSLDLVKGANDTFKKYSGIKVVASQTADWNRAKAMTVTQNLLQAHPNVRAIFAANDEMAMGAVQAVAQAGKEGKILISGQNAIDDAKKAVDNGQLALTLDSNNHGLGYTGLETAVKLINGESVDEVIPIPTTLYLKK
mgnify:CR=1 FL=1